MVLCNELGSLPFDYWESSYSKNTKENKKMVFFPCNASTKAFLHKNLPIVFIDPSSLHSSVIKERTYKVSLKKIYWS